MNAGLVYNWNKVVSPQDEVWVLGDVVMGNREENLAYLERCNGKKFLVPGNHDKCHSMHKPKQEIIDMYALYFEILEPQVTTEIDGQTFNVCHFPYTLDHSSDARYLEQRPVDDGNWLLCGHVHGLYGQMPGPRQIDVGVDAWNYLPVSETQIMEIVNGSRES